MDPLTLVSVSSMTITLSKDLMTILGFAKQLLRAANLAKSKASALITCQWKASSPMDHSIDLVPKI